MLTKDLATWFCRFQPNLLKITYIYPRIYPRIMVISTLMDAEGFIFLFVYFYVWVSVKKNHIQGNYFRETSEKFK